MTDYPDRIPYDHWINSQFSIAVSFGGCFLNGQHYVCDYETCRTEVNEEGETKYFPDLVKVERKKE